MQAPLCPKEEHEITQHGLTRIDNYFWLRDDNWKKIIDGEIKFKNPKIKDYLNTENDYKNHIMNRHKPTEKKIYDELLSRIKEDRESYPWKERDYYYFKRERKGLNYPILCRFKHENHFNEYPVDYEFKAEKEEAEVWFDINKEAADHALYSFRGYESNHSNTFVAYCYNLTGSMEGTLKIRSLKTLEDLDWQIEKTTGDFLWVSDTKLYYVERDEFARGKKIFKLDIKEGPNSKKLVFEKPEEYAHMFLSMDTTTDKNYVILSLASGATEVTYVSHKESDIFDFFAKGEGDITHSIDHKDDIFYILTNEDNATDHKIMMTSTDKSNWPKDKWKEFILEEKGRCLNDIYIYSDRMIITYNNNEKGLSELAVIKLSNPEEMITIEMPEQAYSVSLLGDCDHTSTKVKISLETPISPSQIFDLDLTTGQITLKHTESTPNFASNNYVLKREYAQSRDGDMIPLTIVHKKGLELDGSNPAFVYGYGSYGHGMSPYFSSSKFALIERGFVYCIAHIRGGDEKGHSWYLAGKLNNKLNTFNDYIDSCEYLIDKKYTAKKLIAANGGSAGGLLMGAVTNMRPDLFKVVVADVAFVDVINTISDDSLPLTPPEWEEWGNPIESKEDFNYMLQYSPYDNIAKQNYPAMLYNSGISDEQVTYWEPTKMVAKLREFKTDHNDLVLNMKMHAGHAGASKKYEFLEEIAFSYTFILKQFGMTEIT